MKEYRYVIELEKENNFIRDEEYFKRKKQCKKELYDMLEYWGLMNWNTTKILLDTLEDNIIINTIKIKIKES